MDWGASQLERIDEAEALAREARRRRDGDAETQTTRMETVVEEDSEAMFAAAAGDTEPQERA